jgi:GDP-D-mannose 3', 5'-epimerase
MRTMRSSCRDPLNMGTDHLVSIDELAHIILELSGTRGVRIRHVPGPQGVRGRNSDNSRLVATLGWQPQTTLQEGLGITYGWIREKVCGW